ncbi:MAG: hypothetical protein EPN72_13160 [Nevskiaceae bacterium]|nr:MAG: hypothetical protein EPN63_02715 [Nevskiaceae bacterium]TBR71648.1 MAG: hypothetical protein EPN72_13160 [Nevskiaceae bacterium]
MNLLHWSCALAVLLLSVSAHAAALHTAPDASLDAEITHTRHLVTRSGVVRDESWQQRLIRRPGHIWLERILPAQVYAGHELESTAEHEAHEHFDFTAAALHLMQAADGTLHAEYVDRNSRQVVFVPATEYAAVGFDGSWERAGDLLSAAELQRLKPSQQTPQQAGATTYENQRGDWFTRVLWNPVLRIALLIETGTRNGTVLHRTQVKPLPSTPAAELPWLGLETYTHREYDDFLD